MKIPKHLSDSLEKLSGSLFEKSLRKKVPDSLLAYACEGFFKSNKVIFKREGTQVQKRDDFVDLLLDVLMARNLTDAYQNLKNKFEDIKYIEAKYIEIVKSLDLIPLSRESKSVQCWAQLNFTEMVVANISKKVVESWEESFKNSNSSELKISHVKFISDGNGNEINPDSAIENIVKSLSSSLSMLGFTEHWFNGEGKLVIPTEVVVADEHMKHADTVQLLAYTWSSLEKSEQVYRYFGGVVTEVKGDDLPDEVKQSTLKSLCKFEKTEGFLRWELLEFVAHERVNRFLAQHYLEISAQIGSTELVIGSLADGCELNKGDFVEEGELFACVALCEILSFNINDDESTYEGLTIREWVRGYSVLKRLIQDQDKINDSGKLIISRDRLEQILQSCSLSDEKAKKFMSAAAFSIGSRDLYDCPIINISDGNVLLLRSSIANASTPLVVLSVFSSFSARVKKKGKAFEDSINKFLSEKTGHCKTFKFKRELEEYEYDAVLLWGKTVFVFECKNVSLSHGSPISSYYFYKSLHGHIKQLKRLVFGLKNHPEVFKENFGEEINDFNVVPVILFSLPFSVPFDIDGVKVSDSSTVKRFFASGSINNVGFKVNSSENPTKVPVHKIWKGDSPTDEDFINALGNSFQYKSIADSAGRKYLPLTQLSNDTALWRDIITYVRPPKDSKNPL